jgi:hypothetical protein
MLLTSLDKLMIALKAAWQGRNRIGGATIFFDSENICLDIFLPIAADWRYAYTWALQDFGLLDSDEPATHSHFRKTEGQRL